MTVAPRSPTEGPPDSPRPDATTLAAFAIGIAVAGGNAPAVRYVSCEACELEPFSGAATRFVLAGAIFAVIARTMGERAPRGRALTGTALFGVLQYAAGFGLIYWGFARAPAGLGQVLLATVPLLTFVLAIAHRQERFRWSGAVGAALAVAGAAVVFSSGLDADVPLVSMLAVLAGGLCWAEALIVVKGFPPVHPAAMNALAMTIGAGVLLGLAALSDETLTLPQSASTWVAQAYLVLPGSIGVFWLYVLVVRGWTASAASYQMVLIPLVTVVLSAWLQDERITLAFVIGATLILAGVYVGALRG